MLDKGTYQKAASVHTWISQEQGHHLAEAVDNLICGRIQ